MTLGRLNVFQRLVRQWDAVHPYNAAQILHLRGKPNLAALQQAWYAAISTLGLGPVRVKGLDYGYEAVNGDASRYDVPVAPTGATIESFVTAELNRRFDDADAIPLRPFVVQEGDTFYLGVVYQHWIADSASIRMLLREWFVRVYDPAAASDKPAMFPRSGYWGLFGPQRSRWRVGEQVLSLLRSFSRF